LQRNRIISDPLRLLRRKLLAMTKCIVPEILRFRKARGENREKILRFRETRSEKNYVEGSCPPLPDSDIFILKGYSCHYERI